MTIATMFHRQVIPEFLQVPRGISWRIIGEFNLDIAGPQVVAPEM